jgi:hypothetical protein
LRGETYGAITSADLVDNGDGITGTFSKFSKIDQDGEWFDADRFEPLPNDQAPEIDPNLFPNHRPFFYYFDVPTHTFVYERYGSHGTLSSSSVFRFFASIGKNLAFQEEFGLLEVDHVKEKATLEKLLQFETLKRIQIEIRRPNPDYLTDEQEAEIIGRLENQRARKERVELEAMPGQSLQPDQITLAEAELGIDNGKVITFGRNETGTSETRSSEDYPLEEKSKYDPEATGELPTFMGLVRRILNGRR